MTPQRVSLITLGSRDLDRAKAFYAAIGWVPMPSPPEVVFYQLDGLVLGLYGLDALAADQGRPDTSLGFGAMCLAQNCVTRPSVDEVFAKAVAAGATPLKQPEETVWGGYAGVYTDPDGHPWEIAYNPFWHIGETGRITIPPPP